MSTLAYSLVSLAGNTSPSFHAQAPHIGIDLLAQLEQILVKTSKQYLTPNCAF